MIDPNLQEQNVSVLVRNPASLGSAYTVYIQWHVQNILYAVGDLPNKLATKYDGALDALRN
ncbi:hypothetical protein D3C77_780840 [compost metagenome]